MDARDGPAQGPLCVMIMDPDPAWSFVCTECLGRTATAKEMMEHQRQHHVRRPKSAPGKEVFPDMVSH